MTINHRDILFNLNDINYKVAGLFEVVIEDGLVWHFQDLIRYKNAVVICDTNTIELVPSSLFREGNLKFIKLPIPVLPFEHLIFTILPATTDRELIIAFGSGTIADISKYIAYLTKKKYIIFPTAPSVNAYTSPNASIIDKKNKLSRKAKMPSAVYVDLDIITNAPKRLILSGLYDLICSAAVHLDYLASHILTGSYYDSWPFLAIRDYEETLMQFIHLLLRKDKILVKMLMETLLISGMGMWFCGSSASASQAEHIIAHLIEERYCPPFFHGECVAVGMIFASKIQEVIVKKGSLKIDDKRLTEYCNFKTAKLNFSICKQEWNRKLGDYSCIFSDFTKSHPALRKFIIESQIILPKINSLMQFDIASLLSRNRFTCIDLAFLCGFGFDV